MKSTPVIIFRQANIKSLRVIERARKALLSDTLINALRVVSRMHADKQTSA
jgi:hypothetical protein